MSEAYSKSRLSQKTPNDLHNTKQHKAIQAKVKKKTFMR